MSNNPNNEDEQDMHYLSNEDQGQEVSLVSEGISLISSGREMDTTGMKKWIESITSEMPKLLEEYKACQMAEVNTNAMLSRYLVGKEDILYPGYRIVNGNILTKLTRGALQFDKKVEITPQVDHMIDVLGYCPTLVLYHIDDVNLWINIQNMELRQHPYLGRIKVITLSQIFY